MHGARLRLLLELLRFAMTGAFMDLTSTKAPLMDITTG